MSTVFIAGSISISNLHPSVRERIGNIVSSDLKVVVGDADGADTSIQECLHTYEAKNVTIFCSGASPRNNVGGWQVHNVHPKAKSGSRAFFTAKDVEMASKSDFGLMIWDCKSTGTLSNIIELLMRGKKSVVFVNKSKEFLTIGDTSSLVRLLQFMSEQARTKAEAKIDLSSRIAALSQASLLLDNPANEKLDGTIQDPDGHSASNGVSETESGKLRATLMSALSDFIARTKLSQSQAAKFFGVTQPRISDLTRGKVDVFGLDTLVNMVAAAGMHVEMHITHNS